MTECNRCGDCCETIPFGDLEPFRAKKYMHWHNQYNQAFILTHWHRTDNTVLLQKNFGYKDLHDGKFIYTCDMFDKVSRLCTAHDNRPAVCSDYPWYDKDIDDTDPYLSKNCSFWEDVPLSVREVAVAFKE